MRETQSIAFFRVPGSEKLYSGDHEAVGSPDTLRQLQPAGRNPRGGLQIGVVQGHVEFAEVGEIDLGAALASESGGQLDEFPVPGAAAEGGGEGEQLGHYG